MGTLLMSVSGISCSQTGSNSTSKDSGIADSIDTSGSNPSEGNNPLSDRDVSKLSDTLSQEGVNSLSNDGDINGHSFVDLGLPSGLKWAACNVGASSPIGYGQYFAWGETTPKTEYTQYNSTTYEAILTNLQTEGIVALSGNLTMAGDAAHANWGATWRMPTNLELEELKDKCTWQWTEIGGTNGYKVIGANGKSIFLPAAGIYSASSAHYTGERGDYWSSTSYDLGLGGYSYNIYFSGNHQQVEWSYRFYGFSIRPVSD